MRLPTKEEVETLWPQKKDREYSDDSISFNRWPWWLQTPGADDGYVTRVEGNGNIDSFGYPVDMEIAVRPVLEVEGLDKMDPNAKWFIVQEDDGTTARGILSTQTGNLMFYWTANHAEKAILFCGALTVNPMIITAQNSNNLLTKSFLAALLNI